MSATSAGCYGYKQRGLVRCDPRDSCPSAYGPSWSWALEWQVGAHVGHSSADEQFPQVDRQLPAARPSMSSRRLHVQEAAYLRSSEP